MHVAVKHHQNCEAHCNFSGGYYHDEKHEYLCIGVIPHFSKRNQRNIYGIQHELDAHEHDDGVASEENTQRTHAKQHSGKHQVMIDGDVVI
jgi:hypothetical protein